jgi:hypothetical protein
MNNKIIDLGDGRFMYDGEVTTGEPIHPKDLPHNKARVMTAKEYSEDLLKVVQKDRYNCECQEGGVDAMSVDTDWLRVVAKKFAESIETIERVRELARKLEQEGDGEMMRYRLAAHRIFGALDGEQK